MNRPILVLSGTTLAFATTSVVLLQQVRVERARVHAEATLRGQWEARFGELQRLQAEHPAGTSQAPASAAAPQRDFLTPDRRPAEATSSARSADERFLALLGTPAGHAQLISEETLRLRRRNFDLAKQIHLTGEEEDQLFTVEAEQTLKNQARYARCRLDPSCDVRSLPFDLEQQQKPVKDFLGAGKFAEYERYEGTTGLRLTVRELRARLSTANALSDEQAETLVAVMHEESEKYAAEAQAMGRQSFVGFGGVVAAYDASQSDPEVLSAAQEFARRVRERVADLLTVEQMRSFEELQEEQLSQAKTFLRDRPSGH